MGIQLFCATYDVDACLAEIKECLDCGWTGMGFKTVKFEDDWKKFTGLNNAYFVNSATAGLNLAVDVLKEKYGWADDDEVISTPFTFVSTNHAILLAHMKAVFADIDEYLCLDPKSVEARITPKTKALIFVGFGGNTGRYQQIVEICKKHDIKLILDAAHLAGARLNGEIPGKEADCVVYSFQAVKNLPTADSGMVCFKDADCDAVARKKAWLGINKDTYARSVNKDATYKWRYDVEYVGEKYNGNALMAAVGIVQLRHLEEGNARRREIAAMYENTFKKYPDKIKLVPIPEGCLPSRHLFQLIVEDRNGLLAFLNQNDIYPGVHYVTNTEYSMYSYAQGTCPKADFASEHIISLPLHLRLSNDDVQKVIDKVVEFIEK